jgi:two-component system KDP operon response regulator KdpE
VDFCRREVFIGNDQVKLTATEYDLLKVLVSRAGAVVTHYQLIHEIWGTAQYGDAVHLLRVTMSNLRRKLSSTATGFRAIATEPGVGYRLRPSDCKQSVQAT